MLQRDEIHLLIRTIERIYQCRVCIIDGDGNYLFSMNFPDTDTAHMGELCKGCIKKYGGECRNWDDPACSAHAEKERKPFYTVCPFGGMSLVGIVDIPGMRRFCVFCGVFQPRAQLSDNALVSKKQIPPPFRVTLRELTDREFEELPLLWNILMQELSCFLESQLAMKEKLSGARKNFQSPEAFIRDYINGYFRRNISLADLAEKLGWTRSHTAFRVRKIFGKTFVRLLNERRIENVKWLLRNNYPRSLSFLAKVSGFPSPPYFFRVFRQYTGISPKEYQRQENAKARKNKTPDT